MLNLSGLHDNLFISDISVAIYTFLTCTQFSSLVTVFEMFFLLFESLTHFFIGWKQVILSSISIRNKHGGNV